MPKIQFEQAEVIAAAARAWHKREPAIIQHSGFPIASIVFTTESANSFAGYGVILDFHINDSDGAGYLVQISKEAIAVSAQSQFPGDFVIAEAENNDHKLLPSQVVRDKFPKTNQMAKSLFDAMMDCFDPASFVAQPHQPPVEIPEPMSFSKRLRKDIRLLINGNLPDHGVFSTGDYGRTTVVWKKEPGSSFVYIATSTCSPKDADAYNEEVGVRIAYKRLLDGQCISLPMAPGLSTEGLLIKMFGRYENARGGALWGEFDAEVRALRKKYADRGLSELQTGF